MPPNPHQIITDTEEVKNPLQQSKLHKKGLCDYVINVASGCLHGCTFCYVPSTPAIRARQEHLQDKGVENPQCDWGKYLFVREAHAQQLEEVLANKRTWQETPAGKGVVMLCSGTDPYQNNRTAAVTRACVEVLLKYGKRVRILTRSPLWTQDLDILVNPLVTVGMSLPNLDDRRKEFGVRSSEFGVNKLSLFKWKTTFKLAASNLLSESSNFVASFIITMKLQKF